MIQQTIVTVPNYAEVKGQQYVLTDFAYDMGAYALSIKTPDRSQDPQNSRFLYFGETWLRTTVEQPDLMPTYSWFQDGPRFNTRPADSDWIAVAPHFLHPVPEEISSQTLNGKNVLVVNGTVAYFPQRRVDPELAKHLNKHFDFENERDQIDLRGKYFTVANDDEDRTCRCYHYKGRNYVHHYHYGLRRNKWYLCEPVEVTRQPDGSLQCNQMLFPAPFDEILSFTKKRAGVAANVDVDLRRTTLGQFLNQDFLLDLQTCALQQLSLTSKLSHLVGNFPPQTLKHWWQNLGKSL